MSTEKEEKKRDRSNERPITMTAAAKAALERIVARGDATQKAVISRLVIWVDSRPGEEQDRILGEGRLAEQKAAAELLETAGSTVAANARPRARSRGNTG